MTDPRVAPIAVRRALIAPRYLVHCRVCPTPCYGDETPGPWPGALVGHAKRPAEAADVGREHLRTRHPSGARPGLSPDSGRVQ